MRITGGSLKGRKLASPQGRLSQIVRPTSDKVREALFALLGNRISHALILDLFAGTGALGIEALSRGAQAACFVDSSRQALELIHANLRQLFSTPLASLLQCRLGAKNTMDKMRTGLPGSICFDVVFLDPPYQKNLALPTLMMVENAGILKHSGIVVIEEHERIDLPQTTQTLYLRDRRTYGSTGVWIYESKDYETRSELF